MFRLSFKTENAAFEDDCRAECARILREAADALERDSEQGVNRDANGNRVGEWSLEVED